MKLFSKLVKKKAKFKIGIALSGGGVRGIAHLGILKALNENEIFPDIISGTSAGAIAGVFYADGYKPEEIFEIFNKTGIFSFAKITLPKKGLLNMDKVTSILKENIKAKNFEDLKVPLIVTASNLNEGKVDYFQKGELINKVIASASIPIIFDPILIDNKTYVDGGVFDNLPIHPLKESCSKIIASHVNPLGVEDSFDNILSIAQRTFHLAIGSSIKDVSKSCNLFIEPLELKKVGTLDLDKTQEVFDLGYNYCSELLNNKKSF